MSYKDADKRKQVQRDASKRYREKVKPIAEFVAGTLSRQPQPQSTPFPVNPCVNPKFSRPNGAPYDPEEMLPDGRKRYLGPLFDGQVLDRTMVASPNRFLPPINGVPFTPNHKSKAVALFLACRALDKETQGLGKRENMLDLVMCGEVSMREVKEVLRPDTSSYAPDTGTHYLETS